MLKLSFSGNPGDDPWVFVNSYCIQEINSWKDLNSKLVLQVYRDYYLTKDRKFLKDCWPIVQIAIDYVSKFDRDGDGLLENEGFPDQTYDTWSATGPSAYCGGLWVCALSACWQMALEMGEKEKAEVFLTRWKKAKTAYHEKLWSGEYYLYDTSHSDHFDSIQADSMCGQWWARACGLPSISDDPCVKSSLLKIFNFNVKQFQCGQIGPINGMRPDGKVDSSCMQSVEVWTGTAYGLAATMMQEGLIEEAFSTAKGIARVTYETVGYMFQTPEAWDSNSNYRALAYMRPLAIWGMQYAWDHGARQIRPNPNQDMLEVLGMSLKRDIKKAELPVVSIVFVGDEGSGSRDLFIACWKRYPVDDYARQSCEGKNMAAGMEKLDVGMSVGYEMKIVPPNADGELVTMCKKATVIVCAYSVTNRLSRIWMEHHFLPKVPNMCPNAPIIVVATGIEARSAAMESVDMSSSMDVSKSDEIRRSILEIDGILTPADTKWYSMELQKTNPNIRSHVECSPISFKGFSPLLF